MFHQKESRDLSDKDQRNTYHEQRFAGFMVNREHRQIHKGRPA